MPLTLSLSRGAAPTDTAQGSSSVFVVTATNAGAAALSLRTLSVYETSSTGAHVDQPSYLRPNAPAGVVPVIPAGGSASYAFAVSLPSPAGAGPSPQTPGGAAGHGNACPAPNSTVLLRAECLASDGTVSTALLSVPVLSTIAPFPIAQGGGMQLSSGFNLINYLTAFA
jgi:hypothetical protein